MDFSNQMKFLICKRMPFANESEGPDITLIDVDVTEVEISMKDLINVVRELAIVSEGFNKNKMTIEKGIADLEEIDRKIEELKEKRAEFEKSVYLEFQMLLNSKKNLIRTLGYARTNTNFAISGVDETKIKAKTTAKVMKESSQEPKPSTSRLQAKKSPQKSKVRTPSKKFQAVRQNQTDTDDDEDVQIIACNKNTKNKSKSDISYTSSVFKNLTTFDKRLPKNDIVDDAGRRESSVELKVAKIKKGSKLKYSSNSESDNNKKNKLSSNVYPVENAQILKFDDGLNEGENSNKPTLKQQNFLSPDLFSTSSEEIVGENKKGSRKRKVQDEKSEDSDGFIPGTQYSRSQIERSRMTSAERINRSLAIAKRSKLTEAHDPYLDETINILDQI